MSNNIDVIADNGGGVTLQITNADGDIYQHSYSCMEQCATDIKAALTGDDPIQWDGNELDEDAPLLNPSDNDLRNGGYTQIIDLQSVDEFADWLDIGWANCEELASHLLKDVTSHA